MQGFEDSLRNKLLPEKTVQSPCCSVLRSIKEIHVLSVLWDIGVFAVFVGLGSSETERC